MIGTIIDQYRIEERLGGGGMGEVFRARDLELERSVAIKCVRPDLSDLDEVTVRFRAEARTLAGLAHGNIATVFRFFPNDGKLYLVMEYISGQPFGDLLRDHGAQPPREVVRLLSQALAGLGYAHQNKVVHRDIKPGNLMLDGHNTVKVLDFGIAHLLDQTRITQSGSVLGTPAYMAPEQVLGQQVDGRTDLYALGVVLFEMLTGKLPFQATSQFELMRAHLETQPRSLKEMSDTVPRPLQETVIRALAKDSDKRYQSAAEFSTALQQAVGDAQDDGYAPNTLAGMARSPVKVTVSPLFKQAVADVDSPVETEVRTTASRLPTSIEIQLPPPKKAAGYGLAAALLVGTGVLIATVGDDDSAPVLHDTAAGASQQTAPAVARPAQPNSRVGIEAGGDDSTPAMTTLVSAGAEGSGSPDDVTSAAPSVSAAAKSVAAPASPLPSKSVVKAAAPPVTPTNTPATTTRAPVRTTATLASSSGYAVSVTKVSAHERQRTGMLSRAAGYNGSFTLAAPKGAQPLVIEEYIEVYRDGRQLSRQLIHSQNRRPGRFKTKQRIPGLKELAAGNYRLRLVFENARRRLGSHEWALAVSD